MIEDNADDAFFIRRAFSNIESCEAFVCRNTSEAIAYLQGAGMYADRKQFPSPQAIICDLRLGEESSLRFIQWAKETEKFRTIPIYVLSGLISGHELTVAKDMGASAVYEKPPNINDLQRFVMDLVMKLES